MRKVLIVSYHFPPSNAVGALRPAKFAEYLPEFGWEPVVLAAPAEPLEEGGRWQFEAPPPLDVESVEPWPGLRRLARGLTSRRLGTGSSRPSAGAPALGPESDSGWRNRYERDTARRSSAKDLLYSLMWLPDDRHGWIPPATLRGLELIRRERPDVILVSSPPHSAQVVGLLLTKLSGVPFVADFRDPWVGNPATPAFIRSGPTPRVHDFLESQVLRGAARVLTATRSHARTLENSRPGVLEKLEYLPNGFDPAAFEGLDADRGEPDRFVITYAGNLYHTRTPAPLFEAIGILQREHGVPASRIRVNLIGDCAYVGDVPVREMARESGCEESLRLPGRMPYREALGELVRSDLLLLLAAGQPEQVPAKAYEYAAAGPPILGLVGPGATADFLHEVGRADVLLDADPRAIAAVLLARLRDGAGTRATEWRLPADVVRYDRRALAGELAGFLDGVGRA